MIESGDESEKLSTNNVPYENTRDIHNIKINLVDEMNNIPTAEIKTKTK